METAIQWILECSRASPWLFAGLVILIMAGEGLLLGLMTEGVFRLLGVNVRKIRRPGA
ncbi:MAG: hypothetical protein AB1515_04085 [Nitrospirota bacterium]